MTIIEEEKFTIRNDQIPEFSVLKKSVLDAIQKDKQYTRENDEKKRVMRTATSYKEFKDLVATVNLVPFKRIPRGSRPSYLLGDNEV